jgi:hypothetical protein
MKTLMLLAVVLIAASACATRTYTDARARPASLASAPKSLPLFRIETQTVEQAVAICRRLGVKHASMGCSTWRIYDRYCLMVYPAGERYAHIKKHEEDHCDTQTNWHGPR